MLEKYEKTNTIPIRWMYSLYLFLTTTRSQKIKFSNYSFILLCICVMFEKLKFDKQWRARLFFKNWYWISVINCRWSYSEKTKWTYEVAVLIWDKNKWSLCYTTDITEDVLWRQNIEQIEELITKIKNL